MKWHQITLSLLLLTTTSLSAQNLKLENGWKKDSKFLYIGIENRLFVKGNITPIKNVRCSNGACKIAGDTILVIPMTNGPLDIDVYTEDSTFTFGFDAVTLEYPQVTIVSSSGQTASTLKKSEINNAFLNVGGTLFQNYDLVGFAINVAGTKYYVKGNSFSDEVQKALEILNSGDVFFIEEVSLKNKENNSAFKARLSSKFTIN